MHALLYIDLLTVNLVRGYWELGPVRFDATDLLLFAMFAGIAWARPGADTWKRVPYLPLWIALGTLISISYLVAPPNQPHLTSPHEIGYQLYRYAWRQILFYPLVVLLVADPRRMRETHHWLIGAAVLLALQAIPQGYFPTQDRAAGPFTSGNALGGALAPALVISAGLVVAPGRRRVRALAFFASLLILRALIFTGSRGALLATAAGGLVLVGQLALVEELRPRLLRTGAAALAAVVVLFAAAPDRAIEAPSLSRFVGGGSSTLDWRMQERWPHFARMVLEHPWLGTGLTTDPELGVSGATPHNGYLEIAVVYGIPVTAIYLVFAVLALRAAFRVFMRDVDGRLRFFATLPSAALIALLVHNVVDSIIRYDFGARYFWIFVAFCLTIERAQRSYSMKRPASKSDGTRA